MKYNEVNPFNGNNIEEDAPANATGPSVAGTGDDNTVHTKKKKKNLYDGRTKVARKFIERILKQRESRLKALTKEEVNKEESLTEKVDKKLALKILSMMKNQKFKKTPGDFVPQIYLSGMDKDKLKKEFGRLPRGIPSASSGVPVVDFINYALGKDGVIDTEGGDTNNPKLISWDKGGKTIGKPRTVGDAAKMAGLRLENVELGEAVSAKDKKVIDDFVQMNKGTGAQNFTQRGSIVDYEGRSLEKKGGMGAQQIASLESDPKDDYKIKVHAKMDSRSTQSIVNYLKKSAKKYNIKVEETVKEEPMEITEEVMTLRTKDNVMGLKVYNGAKGLGLKAALLGKYVRVKGSKKQINDFGRTVIGKSSMGSPTEVGDFGKASPTPQEDRMLNKRLKEELDIQTTFTASILEKVNDFGNEHELVETNLKVLQNIVKKKQNQKVKFKDKQATVDLFTASAIMKVYDAVKPDNKKKIEKLMNGTLVDFLKLQKFAMKQVKFA